MIRLFLIFLFFLTLAEAKTDVEEQIKSTNTKLKKFTKNYSSIHEKMDNNAKAILRQKKEILQQQKHLKKLQKELSNKEQSHKQNTDQLKKMREIQDKLKKNQKKLEEELIFTIAQSVSLSVILEEEYTASEESLIEYEVLQVMLQQSKDKVEELNSIFYKNSKEIESLNAQADSLEVEISKIDSKSKELAAAQKQNKKALAKLLKAEKSYKKELKKILAKQDTLKKTLSNLNIIKIDEKKRAQEEKERKAAFKVTKTPIDNAKLPKVKRHGSSYKAVKTKRYKGKKTRAPLDDYTITKEYGTYTDPIYGIKVFNESISLKPKEPNAKVKTVFNGKVIYADKTAVLDNIVIVEHENGLHTIYANLSKISPNIKKGKKIKKGYTIGRVSDELIFEVTQKSFHINPIRLFK